MRAQVYVRWNHSAVRTHEEANSGFGENRFYAKRNAFRGVLRAVRVCVCVCHGDDPGDTSVTNLHLK